MLLVRHRATNARPQKTGAKSLVAKCRERVFQGTDPWPRLIGSRDAMDYCDCRADPLGLAVLRKGVQ